MAHRALGDAYLWQQQHDQAIALDPNDAEGYATLAEILEFAGRPQGAFGLVEKAMRCGEARWGIPSSPSRCREARHSSRPYCGCTP